MAHFSIECTTCQSRLLVRDLSAIGQILACPKCSGMVQIEPPAGWSPDASATAANAEATIATPPAQSSAAPVAEPAASAPAETNAQPAKTAPQSPPSAPTAADVTAATQTLEPPALGWQSSLESQTHRTIIIAFGSLAAVAVLALLGVFAWNWMSRSQTSQLANGAESRLQASAPATKQPSASGESPAATDRPKAEEPDAPVAKEPQLAPLPQLPEASPPATEEQQPIEAATLDTDTEEQPKNPALPATEPVVNDNVEAPSDESQDDDSLNEDEPNIAETEETPIEESPVEGPLLVEASAAQRHDPPVAEEGSVQDQIAERLAFRVQQIELPGAGLREFIELVIDLTALPISFDLQAVPPRQIADVSPIKVEKQDVSIAELLSQTLTKAGFTYTSSANGLTVTSQSAASKKIKRYRYPTDDLLSDEIDSQAAIAALLKRMVAPRSWQPALGARIEVLNDEVWIEQTSAVHARLVAFCERLRLARGLPLKSRFAAERFSLVTPRSEFASRLSQNVTCNFYQPAPFREVLAFLEKDTGLKFFVDWPSLQAEGFTPSTQVTCSVHDEPLESALDRIMPPLGLAWQMVDQQSIEIMGRQRAEAELTLAFYDLGDLIRNGKTAADLQTQVQQAVDQSPGLGDASRWSGQGGPAELYFDTPSRYLAVLQSHAAQAVIQRRLVDLKSVDH